MSSLQWAGSLPDTRYNRFDSSRRKGRAYDFFHAVTMLRARDRALEESARDRVHQRHFRSVGRPIRYGPLEPEPLELPSLERSLLILDASSGDGSRVPASMRATISCEAPSFEASSACVRLWALRKARRSLIPQS